ncbi:putative RNA-binding protein EIF1AD [Merluccius polli]|uniref:Probable RNA-binding protein EIF1AD n=1 Tax=Merluccius polli TaxID=89951 RepID=A0AA47N1C4_MERPO|nr:putative RNA-binding protein EIF1AD [Merluccius polli]
MSQATKRKHVVKEVLGEFVHPTQDQQIVKVIGSRGNNLHEAVTALGKTFLVSMPTKFRKNIWIKRGDYVIVDPIEEGEKVKAEISVILYKDHIQHLQRMQLWPDGFVEQPASQEKMDRQQGRRAGEEEEEEKDEEDDEGNGSSSDSEDDESDLFVNTNRPNYHYSESEDEEGESEEDKEEARTEACS